MRALVFAHGDAPSPELVSALLGDGEGVLIVAADGGAEHALANGLLPDAIVGDLDTLHRLPHVRDALPAERLHREGHLDTSDLEKAVSWAVANGCRDVDVVGAGGGRADHSLANLAVLTLFRGRANVRIQNEFFEISLVDRSVEISGPAGTVVSLVAIGECTGVTTDGLRWPLTDFTLSFSPRGIHNEIASSPARVSVHSGDLLLFRGRWIEKHP